ncbi:MAG: hypothetical protein MUF76_07350 [Hydrogenophaga sp.]|nr:hypothetical protein [Hydrogenophaga sp.]
MSTGVRRMALGAAALALVVGAILLGSWQEQPAVAPVVAAPAPAATASLAGVAQSARPASASNLWRVAEVVQSPKLATEMGVAIDRCRDLRVDFATGNADRASGSDLLVGGKATTCDELFDAYTGKLAELLAPLRHSADPVQRGYFLDGRYNDLSFDHHLLFVAPDDPVAVAKQGDYFKKTDEHFAEVLRDADSCSLDSMVRLHLSHRLTSPRYNTPEARFFIAYILVALNYENAVIVDHMRRLSAGLDPARAEEIKVAVFMAMRTCGPGHFAAALAPYFSKG